MIRKLVIVFAILAVLVTPIPAHGGGGHGGHGHHRNHHHGHQFIGVIYAPFPFDAPCWEEGHWVDQLYMDRSGASTSVPVWVPPHWGCWY